MPTIATSGTRWPSGFCAKAPAQAKSKASRTMHRRNTCSPFPERPTAAEYGRLGGKIHLVSEPVRDAHEAHARIRTGERREVCAVLYRWQDGPCETGCGVVADRRITDADVGALREAMLVADVVL